MIETSDIKENPIQAIDHTPEPNLCSLLRCWCPPDNMVWTMEQSRDAYISDKYMYQPVVVPQPCVSCTSPGIVKLYPAKQMTSQGTQINPALLEQPKEEKVELNRGCANQQNFEESLDPVDLLSVEYLSRAGTPSNTSPLLAHNVPVTGTTLVAVAHWNPLLLEIGGDLGLAIAVCGTTPEWGPHVTIANRGFWGLLLKSTQTTASTSDRLPTSNSIAPHSEPRQVLQPPQVTRRPGSPVRVAPPKLKIVPVISDFVPSRKATRQSLSDLASVRQDGLMGSVIFLALEGVELL
ncbi:hypothetical protein PR048_022782 [Dryococelus australis]|uniref:Uncharacterized protein n=1 Tax=Dryococelus australis TaxID=614101 RepID=A0ABQ9GS70_9NEOP|nr:hypothetical protein PR048_022782 [Dryococelus australis]